MKEDKVVKITHAESLCMRPLLGTAKGSLEEVYSNLVGYKSAIDLLAKADSRQLTVMQALNWFFDNGVYTDNGGQLNFSPLRKKWGADEKVLKQLSSHIATLRGNSDEI